MANDYIHWRQRKSEFCTWRNEREFLQTNFAVQDCLQLMEQLVDIVYYMYQEIHDNFGASGM
jgi:hypothetical protein